MEEQLRELEGLRIFALPLLSDLHELPDVATWGIWTERLSAIATRALDDPERVLQVLVELAPMATVDNVSLPEVRAVLANRLAEILVPPEPDSSGKVFVSSWEEARGRSFEVVFIPGLAEKMFPRPIAEDPILLDEQRRSLGTALPTSEERLQQERLALHVAVGASERKIFFSWPRLDGERARPRVPSFYSLEVFRAAEGRLPSFAELAARAEHGAAARLGWPAPANPSEAIDEAEYDLSVLGSLLRGESSSQRTGAVHYLLNANPHLGRALRFRARRWLRTWKADDGLVDSVAPDLREELDRHRISARSYSATALQHFSACPYRFYLYALLRITPREVPEAIDELDPMQRGSLIHEVQFRLMSRLRDDERLPFDTPERLEHAFERLDQVLDEVAAEYKEELAPAIDRVWRDSISSILADLREWLLRQQEAVPTWTPRYFELAFGLAHHRRDADPASQPEPVLLDNGLQLRGSIDLVEELDATLRATDYKTGAYRLKPTTEINGGETLQPLLYALALEKLYPGRPVTGGRLFFCTAKGVLPENIMLCFENRLESQRTFSPGLWTIASRMRFSPPPPGNMPAAIVIIGPFVAPMNENVPNEKTRHAWGPLPC